MQNTAKPNYPNSVISYDTRSGNEIVLFYNEPTRGLYSIVSTVDSLRKLCLWAAVYNLYK